MTWTPFASDVSVADGDGEVLLPVDVLCHRVDDVTVDAGAGVVPGVRGAAARETFDDEPPADVKYEGVAIAALTERSMTVLSSTVIRSFAFANSCSR